MVRLVPTDDVPWEVWPDSEWVAQPEPEPANFWVSQPTALGLNGYIHCRELWFSYASPSQSVISLLVDGILTTLSPVQLSGAPSKVYFPLPPLKGRYWQITASGTGLQIYENDVEFLAKSWGGTGPYARLKPFGDVTGGAGQTGAVL
jgi:hypothetical protein